eukprot:TRINITY_DN2659_c0_g1_i5.p3 TRINITY_DN2659_c0_g1~~TRINITY_DN2659_c0_g1_i5.p3  ORF type:complete len:231 (-),score=33.45 TRINITY_DN2659_c0_g1_i5:1802-2494(-)
MEGSVDVQLDGQEQNKQAKDKRANVITDGTLSFVPAKSQIRKVGDNTKLKIPALELAKKAKAQQDEREQKRQQEKARRAQIQQQKQQQKPVAQRKMNVPSQRSVLGVAQGSNVAQKPTVLQSQQQIVSSISQQRRQAEWATTENLQRYFSQPQLNPEWVFDIPSGPMTDAEYFEVFPHLEQQNAKRERDSMDWEPDRYDSDEGRRYNQYQRYKRLRCCNSDVQGQNKENM